MISILLNHNKVLSFFWPLFPYVSVRPNLTVTYIQIVGDLRSVETAADLKNRENNLQEIKTAIQGRTPAPGGAKTEV